MVDGKAFIEKAKELRSKCYSCRNCELGQDKLDGHNPHVYAIGNVASKIFFQAESPGFDETRLREPLIGRSGKLFDEKVLGGLGLKRNQVWITNAVLCRPPNNRKPTPSEREACMFHFVEQMKLINPKVIVTMGATPLEFLTGISSGITRLAGKPLKSEKFDISVFPLLHPSFILRSGQYDLLDDHVKSLKAYLEIAGLLK